MLQVKNLTITHKGDDRELLSGFSMVLGDGDKAALIGEEGNGKSTLLKLLYDETLVENYVEYTGEIIRNGARIGYLAQEPVPEERALSIYEFLAGSAAFYDLTPRELSRIAAELLLPTDFFYGEEHVGQLSGGERIKLGLARILIEQPDILLLDEPSNDIDLAALTWLEGFIQKAKVPILYISHDETLLERTANKIIHIEQLERKTKSRYTVAALGYTEYVSRRESQLLRQEQIARKERADYAKRQERFRQLQQKVEHQQNAVSRQDPHGGRLLKKKMHTVKALGRRFEKEYQDMTELPETEEAIYIRFGEKNDLPNGKRVLDFTLPELRAGERLLARNIRLSVTGPEHICIVGKNGTGKTTLLREIAESLQKRSDIRVFYMPQNYEDALPMELTPAEYLAPNGDKEELGRVRTYLGSMKYTADEMGHTIRELSGGQKAKLLLLKMGMEECSVLLLDEPTRNFSPLSNPVIRSLLKGFRGALISVSHDRKYISEVAEKVYELTADGLLEVERE